MKRRHLVLGCMILLLFFMFGSAAADGQTIKDGIVYHENGIYEYPSEEILSEQPSDPDDVISESDRAAFDAGTVVYYPSGIYEYPAEELAFDSTQAFSGVADVLEIIGNQEPKQEYNINGRDHYVSGTFVNCIYTPYYFSPTSYGNLSYHFVVAWDGASEEQRSVTIYLIDRNTGDQQKLRTMSTALMAETSTYYTSSAVSGTWTLGGLDPNHDYYFKIDKSAREEAELTGTISAS